jgi:hypothetical protein
MLNTGKSRTRIGAAALAKREWSGGKEELKESKREVTKRRGEVSPEICLDIEESRERSRA